MNPSQSNDPRMKIACAIIREGLEVFEVTADEIGQRSRGQSRVAVARLAMMAAVYQLAELSLQKTAELFSRRDHTSVIYARRRVREILKSRTIAALVIARFLVRAREVQERILDSHRP